MKIKVGPVGDTTAYIASAGEIRIGNTDATAGNVGAGGLRYQSDTKVSYTDGYTWIPLGKMPWTEVTTTPYQSVVNNGYIANALTQTVITLPANPVVGDIIRVTGLGGYGWRIAQNEGQAIYKNTALAPLSQWTLRSANTDARQTIATAMSSNGLNAVIAGRYINDYIYTSTNSGATWTQRLVSGSPGAWDSIASSADGTKLVAVAWGGYIHTSTNSGVNWTQRTSAGVRNWADVASSSDGTKLVACAAGPGYLYTSTDSGVNWTQRESARIWYCVASSADGTKLVACDGGGYIYRSTDSGVSWTALASAGLRAWRSITSSSDGVRLAVVVLAGRIYTSADSGATWTQRQSNRNWSDIASSSDGAILLATVTSDVYLSTNYGANWSLALNTGVRETRSVSLTSSGTQAIVGLDDATGGSYSLYTSDFASSTEGPVGYIEATGTSIFASVELLYIGYNRFKILTQPVGTVLTFV